MYLFYLKIKYKITTLETMNADVTYGHWQTSYTAGQEQI